ncbi:MAG: alpha/beta superfamily hydrolase [Halobacteriales archaeon]|jgi:alpha/beta superfamily hydrolase
MTSETVLVPGARDVRGTLDVAGDGDAAGVDGSGPPAAVVACPPHPQYGGNRRDRRLRTVCEALNEVGVDCLRFDYGEWDGGYGEREDARNAVRWARERYDRVGLFGYSFGGAMAILAAADVDVRAVSALAPAAGVAPDLDVVDALERLPCRTQVVYGSRDETAEWEPVVEKARDLGHDLVECSADHHFVGQGGKVGDAVSGFFAEELG